MSKQGKVNKQTEQEIKQGLREISEGKVVPLKELEQKDKCPDCKGTGMGQFYFNKNASCDTCNGTGRKGDKPDREKIAETIFKREYGIFADQLLARFPDIEELKNKWTFELGGIARQATNKAVEEAKREEQGRMIRILKDASYALDEKTWQALKEGAITGYEKSCNKEI